MVTEGVCADDYANTHTPFRPEAIDAVIFSKSLSSWMKVLTASDDSLKRVCHIADRLQSSHMFG